MRFRDPNQIPLDFSNEDEFCYYAKTYASGMESASANNCNAATELEDSEISKADEAAMFIRCREIVQASDWRGDRESDLCVIKCLTSSLSLIEKGKKKRKMD
jgi:hypothetical protein